MVLVFVLVNEPLLKEPVPLIINALDPLIVAVPPTVKLFASVAVKLDCKLPPFNASALVPNAFVATPIRKVPLVTVVAPLNELLFAPEIANIPLPFCVNADEPLKLPLSVVVAELVFVSVPLVNVPAPLNVKLLLPPNDTVPATE